MSMVAVVVTVDGKPLKRDKDYTYDQKNSIVVFSKQPPRTSKVKMLIETE